MAIARRAGATSTRRPIRSWPGFWARASSRRATSSRRPTVRARSTPEELAAEKLQQRRENMKRQLDDAVRSGDEKLATKLLRRIQRFDDGEEDEDEDEDP